jgi:CheY-like chemotaxis protein
MISMPDTGSTSFVVVVADDEPLIRMTAVDELTDAGFMVIGAEHVEEAIAILESQAAHVDLLFTDIHMPGAMDGLALAHHASTNWPWIALLLASGKASPQAHEMPTGCRFLAKPYDPLHLIAHAKELTSVK